MNIQPVFYVTQDGWRKVGKLIPTSNQAKKKMKVNRLSADE